MATKKKEAKKSKKDVKKDAPKKDAPKKDEKLQKKGSDTTTTTSTTSALSGAAAELAKATGVEPNAGEALSSYGVRLSEAVAKLPDEQYNKLSEAARKWFDDAVDPINAKTYDKIPELQGFVVTGDAPAADTKKDETPKADAPKADAKKDDKKADKAPKKEKKEKTPRGPRVGLVIAEMVAKNNKLSYEQLCERLDVKTKKIAHEEGSYIHSRWEESRHCVATMNAK